MSDWVMVIDDDIESLQIAGRTLSQNGLRVTALRSGRTMLSYIREYGAPDLILLDIVMPDMDGFDTLENLRALEDELKIATIPVVFLTSYNDSSSEMRSLEHGVADFIKKPFNEEKHVQRVKNIIASNRKLLRVEEAASKDLLTGCLNKVTANKEISAACKKQDGILLMVDLDSFKSVNDSFGHDMGDHLLVRFADILRHHMPDESILGRVGGDEFMLFCPNIKRDKDIEIFTTSINKDLLNAAHELMGADMQIPLGASVGAAVVPDMGTEFNELFSLADRALYNVKMNGKHGFAIYSENISDNMIDSGLSLKNLSYLWEGRGYQRGAMYVEKNIFENIHGYVMRYLKMNYVSAFRVLVEVRPKPGAGDESHRESVMDTLKETLTSSLRGCDIVTRVGARHYFLMVIEVDDVRVQKIIERIQNKWENEKYGKYTELIFEDEKIEF
ncbi:MAG: diguanylate cyclase [Eubacterium sp.]|nr:diguanylate cyclase [Eubacterium sp.]